jgi:ADP-ribose pyrophosphatase YjhB (NUDIX family)
VTEPKRRRRRPAADGDERRSAPGKAALSGAKLAMTARRQLGEITGLEPQAVTSLEQEDDGTWRVTVELLELARVPETDDLLGSYEAELDETGELLGYRRVRRYARSQATDDTLHGGH